MTKLSQSVRESMAVALVKHRFDAKATALCAESVSLFHAVLDDLYDPQTKKLMNQLVKRRKGAFARRLSLDVNVAGRDVRIGHQRIGNSGCYWTAETAYRDVLQADSDWRDIAYLDGPIAERLTAFADRVVAFRNEVESARAKALGALAQFGTGKRLAEGWPEAMAVIGKLIPENDRALPVVQVAALNAEFELPPELAEAA